MVSASDREIVVGTTGAWPGSTAMREADEVADVRVGADDLIYVLTRRPSRVLVHGRSGELLEMWGEGLLSARPHGIALDGNGGSYCVDELHHVVRRFTAGGELCETIGRPGHRSDTGHDQESGDLHDRIASIRCSQGPFNRPTAVVVAGSGDRFITDGYGNARIHHFDPAGNLVGSWGEPGAGPGEFRLPHAIIQLDDDRLLVADRENERLQVFDHQGRCLGSWVDVQRPSALCSDATGNVIVGELAWAPGERSWSTGPITQFRPARISVFGSTGHLLARCVSPPWGEPGSFIAPHGIAIDSLGDIYLSDVAETYCRLAGLPAGGTRELTRLRLT